MKVPYIQASNGEMFYGFYRYESDATSGKLPKAEYCCDSMEEAVRMHVFYVSANQEKAFRVGQHTNFPLVMKFCPFCRSQIEFVSAGTLSEETVTREIKAKRLKWNGVVVRDAR